MTTSANVTFYAVTKPDGTYVFTHHQHAYCKSTIRQELAKYPADYIVTLNHPDEDEVDHYSVPMTIDDYMTGKKVVWQEDVPSEGTETCPWCQGDAVVSTGGDKPVHESALRAAEAEVKKWKNEAEAQRDFVQRLSDMNVELLKNLKYEHECHWKTQNQISEKPWDFHKADTCEVCALIAKLEKE